MADGVLEVNLNQAIKNNFRTAAAAIKRTEQLIPYREPLSYHHHHHHHDDETTGLIANFEANVECECGVTQTTNKKGDSSFGIRHNGAIATGPVFGICDLRSAICSAGSRW
jgi:hypothetical protein